jgi:multiple sugar transport system substrate-binding protein
MKKRMNRRAFLRMAGGAAAGAALAACQPQTVVVEKEVVKEVEKEVTRVVQETVKETVIVEGTPKVVEKTVEKVVTAAPVAAEPVTITWMNWWGGAREPLMLEIIARFQEENPNITVENQVQPWDNAVQRRATAIASQDAPSLIMTPRTEMVKFAHEGLIVPIDDYIAAAGINADEVFYASEINNTRWQGKTYSFPLPTGGGATCIWFYNKNVFREANVDPDKPPTTWQEAEEIIKATTVVEDGVIQKIGLDGIGTGNFPEWLYCNNGQFYSEDSKQLMFSQPEGLETLEWMNHIMQDYYGGIEAYQAFFEGTNLQAADHPFYVDTLAMMPSAVWNFFHFETFDPEMYAVPDQWGVFLVPHNGNNSQAESHGVSGFDFAWNQLIPVGLEQKVQDAAYKWLEFFTARRAGGCWFLFKQHRPSPVRVCNENPEYYEGNPYWDTVLEGLQIDVSVPVSPVQGEILDIVNAALDEVWFGITEPKAALDAAYDEAQPILDAFWSGS